MIQINLYVFYISDKDFHIENSSILYIELYENRSDERGNVFVENLTTNSIHREMYIQNSY